MREFPFSTFQDLRKRLADRDVVLFGAGNIAAKTARRLGPNLSYIVDNNPNLWNTRQLDVDVHGPEVLTAADAAPYIIICTTSFQDVSRQLTGMGFAAERDFLISPILNDLRIIAELEEHRSKLLFTSGLPPSDDPKSGGGIYELTLDGDWTYRKVHSGNCHGLVRFGENFISVDDYLGIVELGGDYEILRKAPLPSRIRAHGVAYSSSLESFYVSCSYADKILVLDKDFQQRGEIRLSDKFERHQEAQHHCNDICVVGDSLYVSMFSHTGNWKRDVFDGVVLEIDLVSGKIVGPVISDLWMPHNVDYLDGSLVVLDSLRGCLLKGNAQPIGQFPGFARGLAYDGVYFYVGQSRNRNYSRYLGLSKNISIDTAIILFDEHTKVSRSFQLPSKISEIHSIVVI